MASIKDQLWDDPLHSMGVHVYIFAPGGYQSASTMWKCPEPVSVVQTGAGVRPQPRI
jgi:hypothetical protein